MLITDSKGVFDTASKSESPQLGLRRSRSGKEARASKENTLRADVSLRWVTALAMLAGSLAKAGYPPNMSGRNS